ncbi:MAG: hypothetical protein NTY66_02870 [Candidatus Vogelbacteria bacterium]|nr:hypothetical protein [Candidatus Vogelbacteria bacterium]
MTILIASATFISTLLGGLFALRFKDRLHLILGFSAGAVIGVAFFDLIPEAIGLGAKYFSVSGIMTVVAIGFVVYMIIDRSVVLHRHAHEEDEGEASVGRGLLGAGSLVTHSFFDGLAIGLALAPVLGVTATLFFTLPESVLGLVLALFSGFFLYLGASDLLPESHHAHPTIWTTFVTILGVGVLYVAIHLAGI